jgi:Glycosyl hydrolases family 2, sugar binding domain/Glycosyl hydrolases family 2, TIM barrel domain/Glycosyl hydrolases family 2
MKSTTLLALLICASALAQDWKPAPGPLSTRWAKDVSPDKVHPEYPRPQMVREQWLNLNGLWDFNPMEKPGTWPNKMLVPFPVESSLSGYGRIVDGPVWYRRTFKIPDKWKGQRVLLHFGAVNWESHVSINGKQIGTHKGGYDAFSFDITENLKDGDNEIVVRANNPADRGTQPRGKQVKKPGGIFYTPSTGVWQTVWLEPVPKNRIMSVKMEPSLNGEVKIQVERSDPSAKFSLNLKIEHRGEQFGWGIITKSAVSESKVSEIAISGQDPQFWSPSNPNLYDLRVALITENTSLDVVNCYFAFRKIEVGKDDKGITRILLNGKPYFQVGPLDQGFWPDGLYTAPTDEALKYDIEITKKLGFNMIRKHVKVEPQRWYYWCDKLGILVWQDMPSGDRSIGDRDPDITRTPESAKQYEAELKAMIDGLRHHPCIVMWVPFNEGWGQYDTKRIAEWVKKYDPTRLVNSASGWADRGVGDVHDWHVYPGPGSPNPTATRAAVLGEFGGLGLPTKDHMWTDKHWGYAGTRDSADLTRKYERLLQRVYELKEKPGLSAAVYTQTTDVETEANGLLTYDRAVIKVDLERVAAANRGDFSKVPKIKVAVPTSQEKGIEWRYRFDKPPETWIRPDFNDARWTKGEGGFGTKGTPGAVVRTEWKTGDIWLRREFELLKGKFDNLHLMMHHDEDAEVYLNGVLAAKVGGYITSYEIESISPEALKALKPGKNTIAIHCHQTGGGQYIDAGLVQIGE